MRFINNPRVYIYPIIVLCVCFFLQLHQRKVAAARASQRQSVPVETVRQAPVNKPAEMTSGNPLPKLYIFGDETSVPFAKDLRARLDGKCTVMHIVSSDAEMRDYFKISQLPAAILFNDGHDELARFAPPFSEDRLVADVEKALAK